MLGRRGARAERGMPRSWTALCLLSLLPSGFTNTDILTTIATQSSTPGTLSAGHTNVSDQETITPSTLENTTLYPVSQDSSGTIAATSEPTVNFTSTSGIIPVPGTMNSSVQTQTSLAIIVSSTLTNFSTSEMTLKAVTSPGNISDPTYNSTSPVTFPTKPYTSFSPTPSIMKEDFKKDNGEELTQVLCKKNQTEAGESVCSLLLAQSEVKPQCLLLVFANSTAGIKNSTKEIVGNHKGHSRKTLIALVTSGILLAVLGTTGYFLMNRAAGAPQGERLGEDPYYTENGGGQGYSSALGPPLRLRERPM